MLRPRLSTQSIISAINMVMTPAAIGVVLGVLITSYINLLWWLIFLGVVLVGMVVWLNFVDVSLFVKSVIAAVLSGLVLGTLIAPSSAVINPYQEILGERLHVKAVIKSDPEYRAAYQRFVIEPLSVDRPYNKILVSTDVYADYQYGQVIEVAGELSGIENFVGDTGREFDYQNYLRVRGVSAKIDYAQINKTDQVQPSIRRLLSILKGHYLDTLARHLPEPHASLAGGITVGSNDALGEDVEELFRRVGLTHIVVLSGYNVAIVVLALSAALAFLPYWLSAMLGFVGIWLFVFLVGGTTTIIRAGIMASIAVVSRLYGSELRALSLLSIAVILMVWHQPLIVTADPSFQLSVLATIGIIVVTPIIEPYFKFVTQKLGLREIIVTTLSTQITVIPWIVYLIGDFSIVSPLANTLVLPIIPVAMGTSFLIYVFSILPGVLTAAASVISYYLLDYVFEVSRLLGSWSWSSLSIPPLSLIYIILLYALIAALLYKLHLRNLLHHKYD